MEINGVSFGAKPINKVNIKKWDKNSKTFEKFPATFVKIESNKLDLSAINNVAQKWKGATYIKRIATNSHWMDMRDYVEIDVYALTTQEKNFDKLKPNKIIGVAEMRSDEKRPNWRKLHYLQVKPDFINIDNSDKKKYKNVGKAIVKSLKKIYSNISLYSDDIKSVKEFYERNGFISDYSTINHYSWSSNFFTRLKIRFNAYMMRQGF